jgi:general secretion pathway protein L
MRGIRGNRMAAFLVDLLWWFRDVWEQIIAGFFGRRDGRARRRLVSLGGDGVTLSWESAPQTTELLALSDLAARLKESGTQSGAWPAECALRLEEGRALVRRLSPIALPASRLRAAALLDLETATPFRPGDAHVLTLRAPDGGRGAGSSCAIVKRAILDPLIEACAEAGLKISRIDIAGGGRIHCVSADDLRRLPGRAGKPANFWAPALMLVITLSGFGTLAHLAFQHDAAIRLVESRAGHLGEEAKAVRGAMEQRAARIAEIKGLRKSVEERKLVSAIWEELARVLPDSSFLTDLAIKDSTVSISGYSAAASSIIVALEGSDMFDQASFTAPVVKVPGNAGDRFSIDLKMGGK